VKKTEYLYGITTEELEEKMYFEALKFKVEAGMKLYKELLSKPCDYGSKEAVRIFYVEKALSHTRKLLEEKEEE